ELLGDGDGDRAAQLSVAEGRSGDQRGDAGELHDAVHDERGQRGAVHRGSQQYGGECDEQRGDADGQLSADDHEPAGQPDGDGGSDGELLGDGDGDRAAQLSVAEGRGADQRGDVGELHDAADDERRQRGAVHRGSEQYGGERDEQRRDADGELSADDHDPAGQPDGDGGPDGDLLGDGDGHRAAQLPVAEGRGADQRGDVGELHDAVHDERGQRGAVHRGSQQSGGECDEQRGDADGEPGAGGADDHEPACQPDGDGGSDGDLLGDGDGDRAAQLPVAEGRGADQR